MSENLNEEVINEVPKEEEPMVIEKTEIELLNEKIEQLEGELSVAKNAYFKAYADLENVKKRLLSEAEAVRKYRIQNFATEILPVIDNLERALSNVSEDENIQTYVVGFQMIYDQLMNALKNEGITVMETLNCKFDPNLHQALMQEKVEGVESQVVIEEFQKGYLLKDRILRCALVKVSE